MTGILSFSYIPYIFKFTMENQLAVAFLAYVLGTLLNTNDREFVNYRIPMAIVRKRNLIRTKLTNLLALFPPFFVAPVQHGPRCAKCDTVEHPSHCLAITECPIGEVIIINP